MAYRIFRVVAKCDLDDNIIETFQSLTDASISLVGTGLLTSNILSAIKRGYAASGFKWKFTDELVRKSEFIPEYTTYDLKVLLSLFTNKSNLIWYIIHKHSFIQKHEQWDYFQEACIQIYKQYASYLQTWKGEIHTWVFFITEQAVFRYKKRTDKYVSRRILGEDERFLEEIYRDYTEDDSVERLMKAIHSLPEKDQLILSDYFNGIDIRKMATSKGFKETYYKSRMAKIRDKIYKNRHKFFVGHYTKEKEPAVMSMAQLGRINKAQSKKIEQYDVNGINCITMFDSVALASRVTQVNAKNISAALTGKTCTAGGYVWKYAQSEN